MKTLVKLLGLVGIVATAILVDRARRNRQPQLPRHPQHVQDIVDAEIIISDVDPEPLTQVVAEGIDPEATRDAHESVGNQRAKLPVRGKNFP